MSTLVKPGCSLREQQLSAYRGMSEYRKRMRDADIKKQIKIDSMVLHFKNLRAGDQPPTGPVSYLCWWYFEAQQAIHAKR